MAQPTPEEFTTTIGFDLVPDASGALKPKFTADPELEKIPYGTVATLMWVLVPGPKAAGAVFAQDHGIYFVQSAAYPNPWPNQEPAPVPAQLRILQYFVEDPNVEPHKESITYKYNVTVTCDGKIYTWDPETENESGGPGGGPQSK